MSWETSPLKPSYLKIEIDGVTHEGKEVKNIQSSYRNWKLAQGGRIEPGDEDRVWLTLKETYPRYVIRNKKESNGCVNVASVWSYIQFLRKRWTKGIGLVEPQEAHRRAAICSSCSKRSSVVGCSVCKQALGLFINPPEQVNAPEGCKACCCYLPLKVWIPMELLEESRDRFPWSESCWMREPQPEVGEDV